MNEEKIFFMVWCPQRGTPVEQHFTEAEAIAEACRIAGKENLAAYVLKSIGVAKREIPPVWYKEIK